MQYKMKWFFLAIFSLALISWRSADLPGMFSWNKTTHDFDRMPRGQVYTYRFLFTNSGDQPITITQVTSSAGMATAKWINTPVRPLQTGWVEISLAPTNAGPVMVSFAVKSDADEPLTTLWVKGEVMTVQEMKPGPNGTH